MSRDPALLLADIAERCRLVLGWTAGLSQPAFEADRRAVDAVLRNLEVIGEAVKGLPEELRPRHPEIPWRKIAGFRDVLIHACFRVDPDLVRDIVRHHVPALLAAVEAMPGETPPAP